MQLPSRFVSVRLPGAVIAAGILTACGDGTAPAARPAASLEVAAGAGQSGEVGDVLAVAPRVLVRDSAGAPLRRALVTFVVRRGHIAVAQARTGSDGTASPGTWQLGEQSGPDTLVATVQGVAPLLLTARANAGPPVSMAVANPNGFQSRVLEGLDLPVYRVFDRFGNGVPGLTLTLRVVDREGTMPTSRAAPAADVTDDFGIVGVTTWIPYVLGAHRLEASVGALSAVATRQTRTDACGAHHVIGAGMTATFQFDASDKVGACGDSVDLITVVVAAPATITVQADPHQGSPVDAADVRTAWLTRAPAWRTNPQVLVQPAAAASHSQFTANVAAGEYDIRVASPKATASRGSQVQVTVTAASATFARAH